MKALFVHHPKLHNDGILYDGSTERRTNYTVEGGDVHPLRDDTVLIGVSERSSPAAIDALAKLFFEKTKVTDLIIVVMPAENTAIHLDMIFTMVDRDLCVIYPPHFIGPERLSVLHWRKGQQQLKEMPDIFSALRAVSLPIEPIFCGGERRQMQEREQWASGCNFVAVRPGVILGYSRNEHTYRELEEQAGYTIVNALDFLTGEVDVAEDARTAIVFEGGELVRGGGGGRCMTLPIMREDFW